MFSTIPTEEKHEKLRVLIEEHNTSNDEDCEETLKGLFENKESAQNALKSKLIKLISPNINEVHSDEEDAMQEEKETAHYDKEVVHSDEESAIKSIGSMKGVIESYLKANKNFIEIDLLRCKKLSANSGNSLK